MTKLLAQNFPPTSPAAVASYDYVDLSSGLGYVNYKGFTACLSGATSYKLGTNDVYSYTVSTAAYGVGGSPKTYTFDSSVFNLPQTVEGTAFLSVGVGSTGGGTTNVQAQLMKVKGATVTNLSASLSGASTVLGMLLIPLELTQTRIGAGEFLRLNVIQTALIGAPDMMELAHDPKGRNGIYVSGATLTTALNCFVPFRIDIGQ